METGVRISLMRGLVPVVVFVLASCSSEPKQEGTNQTASQTAESSGEGAVLTAFKPGVPGGLLVGTYRETPTVTGIDKEKRKVTLVTPNGTMGTFKAGSDVANFDQIQVGDQVNARVTQELAVFVRKKGEPSSDEGATTVALAPVGSKPGALIADTIEGTAKVTSVDLKQHKATLQFPDGTSKTFKVRPDLELSTQSVGQEVVIRTTDALAISVEKP
jgi:Cu/Ag efflux protein CusF